MSHTPTALLTSQFRENPDHKQTRQGGGRAASVTMIGNGLQTGIQRVQIKHQGFLGKGKLTQKCCIVHKKDLS
jgi:hypothetical protein